MPISRNAISSITVTAVSALVPMTDIGEDEIGCRCATVDRSSEKPPGAILTLRIETVVAPT
jgi:hypothetical protein